MQRNLIIATLAVAATCASFIAHADSCDAVYNANVKLLKTPNHGYLTLVHSAQQMDNSDTFKRGTGHSLYAAKTETSETIFDGKTSYLMHHGKWMRSPIQPQDLLADAQEKLKTNPDTCALVGDQSIDGQAATLYRIHGKETNNDAQEWISKSSGLPVHVKSMNPDGSGGEIRYDYDNVRAPAGVP